MRLTLPASLLVFVMWCGGCHPLPAGDLAAVSHVSDQPRTGNVYLIRGWRDLYSKGIDHLADALRRAGISAHVYRDSQSHDLAGALKKAYAINADHEPLVLIGFSYGADEALRVSDELLRRGLPVDLVITIDPVTPPPVPANVVTCYNYYQSNGIWDLFPWLRGVPLRESGVGRLVNVDLRKLRPDLLEPNTSHANIASNPMLQSEILARVMEVCRPRERR